ncbi:MAG TPA: hypothetical protein VGM30_09560 [Puia sp.]|jgi:hypothetical protein
MMIEKILGFLAGSMITIAQIVYLTNTIKRKIRPSVLSWMGWALLMGTSLISQVLGAGWQWSLTSLLLSAVGATTIAITAFCIRNFSLSASDWKFLVLGLGCIGIYFGSHDPWSTTIFAIIADGILGIPTIIKAYKDPVSERSMAWIFGVASQTIALVLCIGHSPLYVLFPLYLFLFNGTMVCLTRAVRKD